MTPARALGIVRPARRPPGWRAPGPLPVAPFDRPEVWPRAGEDLCYLAGEWRILQRIDGHRWSLDDLVTAWFAAEVRGDVAGATPERIVDLGCGIGSVLLLLAWRFREARCLGLEAQDVSVDLARRSFAWNGVEDRCELRHGDLRDPTLVPEGAAFDLVTGTPPYLPSGTATVPARVQRGPCRLEWRGGIEAYCSAAARLLRRPGATVGDASRGAIAGGLFVTCASTSQPARVDRAAAAAGLVIERRLEVIPRAGRPALFSVYAMRHAGDAAPRLPPTPTPLVVRDERGERTAAFRVLRAAMGMPP